MSTISKVKWAIIVVWLFVGVLVLFEVLNLFSDRVVTFIICLLMVNSVGNTIENSMNKEKNNDKTKRI